MVVPEAPATLGPQRSSGGWFTCYQHSPAGALLAAIGVWASGTGADAADVVDHLAVNPTAQSLGSDILPAGLTLDGYEYASYSPRRAVVDVVLNVEGEGDVAATTTMEWVPGIRDWRLEMPASGVISASLVGASLGGFVEWRQS